MISSCSSSTDVYTVEDWLFGCVNFDVPKSAVEYICANRLVSRDTAYADYISDDNVPDLRLLKADLYKWIIIGSSKVNNTSDGDNGWSHSSGGYTMSEDDKRLMRDEANAIYEELEPSSVFAKKRIRMRSAGIMPAYRDLDGTPLSRMPL